jgi:thiol-disulfide isomerase/thioredoxin
LLSLILAAVPVFSQNTSPAAASSDALAILRQVTQKYAEAKSYHIEATEDLIRSNEFGRDWRKTIMSVTVAPGDRYRYEGRGAFGSALLVSDGKTTWTYHYDEHLFTEKPIGSDKLGNHYLHEDAMRRSQSLRETLARAADELKSASLLPEENVAIDGTPRRCVVIHFTPANLKTDNPEKRETQGSGTYWIDKDRLVIVKAARESKSFMSPPSLPGQIIFQNEVTTVFPVVELNASVSDATFTFTPPVEAKLTDEFPEQRELERQQAEKKANPELIGKAAPDLKLVSAAGKLVSLSSYRGKPVLIDVWATWCGPCVAMIPELKKLNSDLNAHGITFLSVDVEDDPDTANEFLKHQNVT